MMKTGRLNIGEEREKNMLDLFGLSADTRILAFIGVLLTFALTLALLKALGGKLPRDAGRAYAHDGTLSVGKPRGAGLVFVLAFVAMAAIFLPFSLERLINLALITAAMLTGFMDDRAGKPWGELKKGILDLILSLGVALTFLAFNPTTITLPLAGASIALPPVLFAALAVLLVWTSINVTNCADGVDGLSGSLSIITLLSVYLLGVFQAIDAADNQLILFPVFAVLAYLWYNATPSLMIMGDAGSRALGLFNRHRHPEDRQPVALYAAGPGPDPRRRPGPGQGDDHPAFQGQHHETNPDAAA